MKGILRGLICMMALLTSGCMTIDTAAPGRQRANSVWMLGFVRVLLPNRSGRLSAVDVRSLGLGWDGGPYLGWKAGNWIVADPAECQLIVVIRSPAQAENAAKVLQSLGGQAPCIVDYTRSLHP